MGARSVWLSAFFQTLFSVSIRTKTFLHHWNNSNVNDGRIWIFGWSIPVKTNVLLANAMNIPMLHMTGFAVQGHHFWPRLSLLSMVALKLKNHFKYINIKYHQKSNKTRHHLSHPLYMWPTFTLHYITSHTHLSLSSMPWLDCCRISLSCCRAEISACSPSLWAETSSCGTFKKKEGQG